MATNYSQLETMMQKRYHCTSLEIAEKLYKGREDIADVIRSSADADGSKEIFEKHKGLRTTLEGEDFKGRIGKAGAMDFLKRVVANWIAQDLFVMNLNKNKMNCELGKFHKDRDFEGCLSVEPTAILWSGERMKSRHRLLDIQIVYGKSMEDGFVTVTKDRYLKLIEKKTMLLTMNMTTLKYSLLDFYTTDTYAEEFSMKNGVGVVKIALKESKGEVKGLGEVRDDIKRVMDETVGANAVKPKMEQANFIAVMALTLDGVGKNLVGAYTIPSDAVEKRKKAGEKADAGSGNGGGAVKADEVKKAVEEVDKEKPQSPTQSVAKDATQPSDTKMKTATATSATAKANGDEAKKPTPSASANEQTKAKMPQTEKVVSANTTNTNSAQSVKAANETPTQTSVPTQTQKPIQKPIQKPTEKQEARQETQVEEEGYEGYDFSALDAFA